MNVRLNHPPLWRAIDRAMETIATIAAIGVVIAIAATGCTKPPPPAENIVYGVAIALTAADNVALKYFDLPACGPTPKPLCSEAAVKARIKAATQTAHDAVKAAEANPGAVAAAQAAVDALVSVTPKG